MSSSFQASVTINVNVTGADQLSALKAQSQATTASMVASNTQVAASWQSMGTMVMGATTLSLMSFERLQSAQVSLANAQNNVKISQANLILTLRQYGEGSVQAIKASLELQNAQNSLSNSQRSLNMQWIQMATTVIPQFFTMLPMMAKMYGVLTNATQEQTAAMVAQLSVAGALLGMFTMGVGLIFAAGSFASFSAQTNQTMNQSNIFNNYGQSNINSAMSYANGQLGYSYGGQSVP